MALLAVAVVLFLRSARRLDAPQDQLLVRMIAARAEDRDPFVVELGKRGPTVIPLIVSAYKSAGSDPDLRVQLAMVLNRTQSPEAVSALEQLLQQEKDPAVRGQLETFLASMKRSNPVVKRSAR